MKLEFVDALAVADVVLDAVHRRRTKNPDYAPKSCCCKKRFTALGIVRPATQFFFENLRNDSTLKCQLNSFLFRHLMDRMQRSIQMDF